MPGTKHDDGKIRWDLMPFDALDQVALVLTLGAAKYGDRNWEDDALSRDRLVASAFRHLSAHQQGDWLDQEWQTLHLAHAATASLMALAKHLRVNPTFESQLTPTETDEIKEACARARANRPAD